MSKNDTLEAAKTATIIHMRGLQTTPPPTDLPDPKTPKAVHTITPGNNTKMEDTADVTHMELAAQTTARAKDILRRAQVLTRELARKPRKFQATEPQK